MIFDAFAEYKARLACGSRLGRRALLVLAPTPPSEARSPWVTKAAGKGRAKGSLCGASLGSACKRKCATVHRDILLLAAIRNSSLMTVNVLVSVKQMIFDELSDEV